LTGFCSARIDVVVGCGGRDGSLNRLHLGSLTRLKQAPREELLATPGAPEAVAESVFRSLCSRPAGDG
jgi:excinuclease UvrABC nuclease subunit